MEVLEGVKKLSNTSGTITADNLQNGNIKPDIRF